MNLELAQRTALDLVVDAGRAISALRDAGNIRSRYKDNVELVTAADHAADRIITEGLLGTFPAHRVLSEESTGADWRGFDLGGPVWIVDPVDGTVNLARGSSRVGVSVALAIDGVVQLGIVHGPFERETFVARKGAGAFLDERRLVIDNDAALPLRRCLVGTGFPHHRSDTGPLWRRVATLLAHCGDIRRLASPALDICWVAAGRLDAHTESLAPWDVAAAGLIAREAGARVGHCGPPAAGVPQDLDGHNVLVARPDLFDELRALLA